MTRSASVSSFGAQLEDAIKARDWGLVDRIRERLMTILLEATADNSPTEVQQIEALFARAHAIMILHEGVSPSQSPTATAWMMKAEAKAASLARRVRPQRPSHADDHATRSARERILFELARSNRGRMNNRDLARACAVSEETIARIMPVLRTEGLVRSWRAGRAMLNEITAAGRETVRKTPRAALEVIEWRREAQRVKPPSAPKEVPIPWFSVNNRETRGFTSNHPWRLNRPICTQNAFASSFNETPISIETVEPVPDILNSDIHFETPNEEYALRVQAATHAGLG